MYGSFFNEKMQLGSLFVTNTYNVHVMINTIVF